MADATVLVVTQDNLDLLRLTVESLRKHNPGPRYLIWVWCNGCTDGSIQWARDNADRVFVKDPHQHLGHHHAEPLDKMVQEVRTPYVVTLDNDVLVRGPVVDIMLKAVRSSGAFAVGPLQAGGLGTVDHFGRKLWGQKRIDPCCAMFQTDLLSRMVRTVSFTPAEVANLGKFYDTGGLVRAAAEAAGYHVVDSKELRDNITHVGSMTWAMYADVETGTAKMYARRRKEARDMENEFRNGFRYDLVVARHNEDTLWTERAPGVTTFVYDKSDKRLSTAVPLENVGREAHTYAEHVARNYDTLNDVTVFCQGNPFDHAPEFMTEAFQPITRFVPIGPARMLTGPKGDSCHALPMAEIFKELTGREFPEDVPFTPGAQFAAHKNALRRYPRTWWRRLADKLADPGTQRTWPWALERMWRHLFTEPPLPHFYQTVFGWFGSCDVYRRMVETAGDGAHFVEVGAWAGKSSSYMATEIRNSNKRIRFDVVDTFKGSDNPEEAFMKRDVARAGGSMRPTFVRNMRPVEGYYNVVESDSVSASVKYTDNSLDFVWVDASHDEASVAADIRVWYPKVKPGGWIGGDDLTEYHPGVEAAVSKFFKRDYRISPLEWLVRKPA